MTYDDLMQQLRAKPALIVHFSHHANMREGGTFPEDLHYAIQRCADLPLSCCAVWPSHMMNLPGSIGVILRPRSASSVIAVDADDAGSLVFPDGSDGSRGAALTAQSFEESFAVRPGNYNEWRMRNTDAVGVYFEEPLAAKKRQILECEGIEPIEDIAVGPVQSREIYEAFACLPIVTRRAHRFVRAPSLEPFSISDLY